MEEREITNKTLLEIAQRKREDIAAHEPQELQSLNDTPIDRQPTGTKPMKASNRQAKKQKSNLRELPKGEFIIIPNEFVEATSRQYLRPNESKVLWHLLRQTWGWGKQSEFIPLKQFNQKVGISKEEASRALSSLRKRRIVEQLRNKTYAIQADTSLWKDRPKKKRLK